MTIKSGYVRSDFCVGDKVMIITPHSKHSGLIGIISCMRSKAFIRVIPERWMSASANRAGILYYASEIAPYEEPDRKPLWEL